MKEFWNKLIKQYRKNEQKIKDMYSPRWSIALANDENRKIKEVFFKNFHKNIEECDYME